MIVMQIVRRRVFVRVTPEDVQDTRQTNRN